MSKIDPPAGTGLCTGADPGKRGRPGSCPRCGAAFSCGVDAPDCWCTRLPPIDPARLVASNSNESKRGAPGLPDGTPGQDCLCPNCLALLTGDK
ncbi:MAG: cysteine-rich CWC family protein [Limnobacter sp.]|nr:cysteine-rich CWC family protein [Limnobacter sp.]